MSEAASPLPPPQASGCVSTGAESSSVLPQSLQVGLLAFDRFRPVLGALYPRHV